MDDQRRWYAGVDWATQSHHVRLTDGDGRDVGEKIFGHGGAGLGELVAWLMAKSGAADPGQIHVAIEVPHGPVVETLLERRFNVYAVNPKQLDRFRDRFTLAGAKDDSRDAEVMASALRTDPRCFRPLKTTDPAVIELREWSRIAEDLGPSASGSPTGCASSCGDTIRPSSSSTPTSVGRGCSNSGSSRQRRQRQDAFARRRWLGS